MSVGEPQNLEAEQAVLAAVLLDPAAMPVVTSMLGGDEFVADRHRHIFVAMKSLAAQGKPIDAVSIKNALNGNLERVGGAAYITSLLDASPDVTNVGYHAEIVKKKAAFRHMAEVGRRLVRDALAEEPGAAEQARVALLAEQSPPQARLSSSLFDLQQEPPPPVRWVVEGLLPERALSLLFGKPFGGKSLFALQLGLHAASGLVFLPEPSSPAVGFAPPRPLRVLYVDEEMGLPLFHKRIQLMKSGQPEFRSEEVLRRFRVTSRAGLKLDDRAKLESLRNEIRNFDGGPPDLVVLDTLRRMHDAPEKDSFETAKLTAVVTFLAEEFGASILGIHHSKKGPQDDEEDWREAARGSGDLVASCQSVVAVWKADNLLFSARADVKAAGEIQPFPLVLDPETLLYRRQSEEERHAARDAAQATAVKEAMATLNKALRKLKEAGGTIYPASWTAWRHRATGKHATLATARDALLFEGTVVRIKRHGRGGGDAYLFPEDFAQPAAGTGAGTRSDEAVG